MASCLSERIAARREYIKQGKHFCGVSPDIDPNTPPAWYDPAVFKRAQQLFKSHAFIIGISHVYGLILILFHTTGLIPLLVTGNSETISKLFSRYLSTIVHVFTWFSYDPFDKKSKCHKSLQTVRGMHKRVGDKMNQKHNLEENGTNILWVNQYSMFNVQFSFVGLMAVFPKQLGYHNFSEEDFHCLFHFWRVIGYCLGIEDRFNLCDGTDEETFELCRQLYFQDWVPILRNEADQTGIEMGKGICLALAKINSNLRYNSMMKYAAQFLQLNEDEYELESLREKVEYYKIKWMFKYGARFKIINIFSAKMAKLKIKRAITRRSHKQNALEKEYPQVKYENDRCPFEVKFGYSNEIK